MPLKKVAPLTMRGVSEVARARMPAEVKRTLSVFGTGGMAEGKTVAKRKKNRGIIEADANASRAQTYPQSPPAYMFRNPLLTVQIDIDKEKIPKYRLLGSLGFLAQTPIPRDKFASAARSKRMKCPLIALIR